MFKLNTMVDILVISHACQLSINRKVYRELQKYGWHVELVVPDKIKIGNVCQEPEPQAQDDPKLHLLPVTSAHLRFHSFLKIDNLLNQIKPKIILLENGPASIIAIQVGKWARANNSKLICLACDNLLPNIIHEIFRFNLKPAIVTLISYLFSCLAKKNIAHIFVLSEDGNKVMNQLGFKGRISKIPLGFDESLFYANEKFRNEARIKLHLKEITIAYFGRMIPEKGVHILIKALGALKHLKWQLLLDSFSTYSDPYGFQLQKLIKENNIESRVVYFDAKHVEMPKYINAADVVVLPSISTSTWKEQYGRVVPESMACGKLVIVSNCGALSELVGDVGLIFSEADVSKLSEYLNEVILNPQKYDYLRSRAIERAHSLFGIKKQSTLMNEVFTKIM